MSIVMNNDQSKKSQRSSFFVFVVWDFGFLLCYDVQDGFDSQAHAVSQ
jgi:hypothetical protein